jgi:TolB-like protein/DNA-binding winged helix-turn-helix (wHTH) protein
MPPAVHQFEDFELDPVAYELRRAGRVVRLERIPLELLFLLVERRGQLVTRQEIVERVWGRDVFVDSDSSVNTAVRKIRQALKDNSDKPRLLFTVAGKGYRFVPPVAEATPVAANTASPPHERPAVPERPSRHPFVWLLTAALLLAISLVAGLYLRRQLQHTPTPHKAMLAVLPFLNLSGDSSQDYFAEGMTEEMITELGSLDPARLGVIARTSAMQYKGSRKGTVQIARELGVNYLLEGSVRRYDQRIRITAQLIQTSDQTHLWADNFDRDLSDVIRLQSEVARTIASKIQLTISQQTESHLAAQRVDAQAHEAYLQGLQAWNQRAGRSVELAIADFQRAIEIQPNYALAHAALARVYALAPVFSVLPPAESMPKAREAVTRALVLDPLLAEAHTTLAFVKAHFDYDWNGAQREYRRALELNPSDANTHLFYSNSYLSPFGRHDEAIEEMKIAVALDPLSLPIQSFMGRTYLWARRYDEALAQFERVNRLNPNFAINHERSAHALTYIQKFDGAIQEEAKARILAGEDPKTALEKADALRLALASNGPHGYWQKVLEFSEASQNLPEAYVGSYGHAILYARLGQREKALGCLEQALSERQLAMTEIGIEPAFDALRSEPRFASLLRQVGVMQ